MISNEAAYFCECAKMDGDIVKVLEPAIHAAQRYEASWMDEWKLDCFCAWRDTHICFRRMCRARPEAYVNNQIDPRHNCEGIVLEVRIQPLVVPGAWPIIFIHRIEDLRPVSNCLRLVEDLR